MKTDSSLLGCLRAAVSRFSALAALVCALSAGAAEAGTALAGRSIPLEQFPGATKWTSAMTRAAAHPPTAEARCAQTRSAQTRSEACRLAQWSALLETLRGASPRRQMEEVNRFINQTRFVTDADNWGAKDYWADPGEFFFRGGDCEDYAIAKYLSLKSLGIARERLRLLVLLDARRAVVHAVLTVELDGQTYVLDNLDDRVRPLFEVAHYRPLYSLNEDAAWIHIGVRQPPRQRPQVAER